MSNLMMHRSNVKPISSQHHVSLPLQTAETAYPRAPQGTLSIANALSQAFSRNAVYPTVSSMQHPSSHGHYQGATITDELLLPPSPNVEQRREFSPQHQRPGQNNETVSQLATVSAKDRFSSGVADDLELLDRKNSLKSDVQIPPPHVSATHPQELAPHPSQVPKTVDYARNEHVLSINLRHLKRKFATMTVEEGQAPSDCNITAMPLITRAQRLTSLMDDFFGPGDYRKGGTKKPRRVRVAINPALPHPGLIADEFFGPRLKSTHLRGANGKLRARVRLMRSW